MIDEIAPPKGPTLPPAVPTHAIVYISEAGETFHCFAYGDGDARDALAHLSAAGLRGWTLPYDTYLRRDAVGSGAVIIEE